MKKAHIAILLFFITLCGLPESADGTDFLAKNSDEVKKLVAQAQPGDSIVLADGTWQDVELLLDGSGTADNPITLRAQTPGRVRITGQSRVRLAGQHLVVSGLLFQGAWHHSALVEFRKDSKKSSEDCRFTGCAIVDCNPPQLDRGFKYISLYGRRNRVDHCRLEGKRNEGTTLVVWLADGPVEHRIDHVHFGPRPRLEKNGGETIRIGDSTTSMVNARTIVENNYFEECDGEGEIISNKSCENIYRHNTFVRCEGALTLRHGHRCLVEGNYFLGHRKRYSGGVRIIGEDHRVINNYFADLQGDETRSAVSMMNGIPDTPLHGYSQVTGAVVAFNSFVNCKWSLAIGLGEDKGATLAPKDCLVANNLFSIGKRPLLDEQTQSQGFVWQGNLIQANNAISEAIGRRVADLGLKEGEDGVWRPSPDSPAAGAALGEFPLVVEDIDRQPRPEPRDVGCVQISASSTQSGPLSPGDVGVSWKIAM